LLCAFRGVGLLILHLVRPTAGGMRSHVQALLSHFSQSFPVGLALPDNEDWAAPEARRFCLPLSGGVDPGRDFLACCRLYLLLRRVRPALIHIHGFKAFPIGALAAKLARVPVLVTVHNFPAHRGGAAFFPYLSRLAELAAAHYIAVSGSLARELMAWGVPPHRVKVIYNGIDLKPFGQIFLRRQSTARIDDQLVVGTIARMAPQKGLPYLVEAAEKLADRFPQMRFVIAGEGPLRQVLQEAVHRAGLKSRVTFPGYCRDIAETLSKIDIFVLPSLTEGLSITLLEAMAAGCAVVATRVGGVPEIVDHGITGLLVQPASADALAEAVATLAINPELRDKFSAAGKEKIEAHFTLARMLTETASVYAALINREFGPKQARL